MRQDIRDSAATTMTAPKRSLPTPINLTRFHNHWSPWDRKNLVLVRGSCWPGTYWMQDSLTGWFQRGLQASSIRSHWGPLSRRAPRQPRSLPRRDGVGSHGPAAETSTSGSQASRMARGCDISLEVRKLQTARQRMLAA